MKECMKTNNPTEFRDADYQFNKAMDAYERSQGIIHGIDVSDGPDVTAESQVRVTVKEGNDTAFPWYGGRVINTSYSVNLRAEPTIDSSVIARIHPDSEFMICAIRTPDWYKVRLKDGTEGYASSKYVARVMPNEHT